MYLCSVENPQQISAMDMFRGPTYLPSRRNENRGPRKTGFQIGSADSSPRAALDLHRRRHRLRHRISLHHRQARIGIKPIYRK